MVVAIDLDRTLTADPQFFRAELEGLRRHGAKVYVVTGNPQGEEELSRLGFVKHADYDGCIQVPRKHIASAKVNVLQALGASVLIDNRAKNCRAAVKAGFRAHHVMLPDGKG